MQRWISISACSWVALALMAGCVGNGGSQFAPAGSASLYDLLITPRNVRPNLNRHITGEGVVKPNCRALQKTLFVSDVFGGSSFTGAIYMFDYVTGASLGQVAQPPEGFLEVQGGCADNAGNVYFANTGLSTIDEYDHSGTFVVALSDAGNYPTNCSYDKTTGDLAVSNVASSGPSNLAIFHGGVLQHIYYPPNTSVQFLAYQGTTGTLWLDGGSASGFQYDSFKNGKFKVVGIHGATIGAAGAVMWSDKTKFMNVGDQSTFSSPTFYEVDDRGNVRGSVVLTCTQGSDVCDIVQATIKGPGLVGPDAVLLSANRFAYPGGGPPTLNYAAPYEQPIGSAISTNKRSW